ncbi:MAG: lysozyme [Alphaproteobacteria bacterium]
MQTNESGVDLIKRFEGCRLEAYLCPAGVWTVGYGHTGADVRAGVRITEDRAEELLREDLQRFEDAVERLVMVPINPNEFSALVSLTYNIGEGNFSKSSCLRYLNQGNRAEAANRIELWNKARVNGELTVLEGLVRRRAAEKALFLTPTETETVMSVPTMDVPPAAESEDSAPPAGTTGQGQPPAPAPAQQAPAVPPSPTQQDVEILVQERLVQAEMERQSEATDQKIAVGATVSGAAATASVTRNAVDAIAPDRASARENGGALLVKIREFTDGVPEWVLVSLKLIIIAGIIYILYQLWRRGRIQQLSMKVASNDYARDMARQIALKAAEQRGLHIPKRGPANFLDEGHGAQADKSSKIKSTNSARPKWWSWRRTRSETMSTDQTSATDHGSQSK